MSCKAIVSFVISYYDSRLFFQSTDPKDLSEEGDFSRQGYIPIDLCFRKKRHERNHQGCPRTRSIFTDSSLGPGDQLVLLMRSIYVSHVQMDIPIGQDRVGIRLCNAQRKRIRLDPRHGKLSGFSNDLSEFTRQLQVTFSRHRLLSELDDPQRELFTETSIGRTVPCPSPDAARPCDTPGGGGDDQILSVWKYGLVVSDR